MAKRLTKQEKLVEAKVDAAFKKFGSNRQFGIFDLGKIADAGRAVGNRGGTDAEIEAAVSAACDQYEVKKAS